MPDAVRRTRMAVVACLAAALTISTLSTGVQAHEPPGQGRFMDAIGHVESGGRYDARNPHSGAYGKYQIMPANWKAWAALYLGNAQAKPTPANQEIVARAKIRALHHWLDSWVVVAHWWLTGSSSRDSSTWSDSSTAYVHKVITLYKQRGGAEPGKPGTSRPKAPRSRRIGDASKAIVYQGGWLSARHGTYSGDTVRYSSRSGATARLTFTGRSVTWVGPKGPTRGRARVFVDGKLAASVDLGTSTFRARANVFARRWPKAGRHTIRIEVLGTTGRPMVAIDDFTVRS